MKHTYLLSSAAAVLVLALASAALLYGCAAGPAGTSEKGEVIAPYTVTEIAKNVYRIEDCTPENPEGNRYGADGGVTGCNNCSDMYLIVGRKKAMLIDLSNRQEDMMQAAASLRRIVSGKAESRPLIIAVTHDHGDHIGMAEAFADDADATFWLPADDFGPSAREGRRGAALSTPADRTVYFGDLAVQDLGGGFKVQAKSCHGHTPGSVIFFLKKLDMAFSGDSVGSGDSVWIFDAQGFGEYRASLDSLVHYLDSEGYRKLDIRSGHYWQKELQKQESLGMQYVRDMQALVHKIGEGSLVPQPLAVKYGPLDIVFRYGTAAITWSSAACREYFSSINPWVVAYYEECFLHPGENVGRGATHKDRNEDVIKLFDTWSYASGDPLVGEMNYYLYDPTKHGSPSDKDYPLIMVFHGANNGRDGIKCTTYTDCAVFAGPEYQKRLGGAYVLFPKANERDTVIGGVKRGWGTWMTEDPATGTSIYLPAVTAILEKVISGNHIDPSHVIVGGTSAGGYMTWRFLGAHADMVSGAFLMAPAGCPTEEEIARYGSMKLPLWIIHGVNDEICKYPLFTGSYAPAFAGRPEVRISALDTVRYGDKSVVRMNVGGIEMGQHLALFAVGSNMIYDDGTPYDPAYSKGFIDWLRSL